MPATTSTNPVSAAHQQQVPNGGSVELPLRRYFPRAFNWFPCFAHSRLNSANGTGRLNDTNDAFLSGLTDVLEIPRRRVPPNADICSLLSNFTYNPPETRHQRVQTDRIEESIPPTSSDADPATHQQQDPTDGVGATSNDPSIPDVCAFSFRIGF